MIKLIAIAFLIFIVTKFIIPSTNEFTPADLPEITPPVQVNDQAELRSPIQQALKENSRDDFINDSLQKNREKIQAEQEKFISRIEIEPAVDINSEALQKQARRFEEIKKAEIAREKDKVESRIRYYECIKYRGGSGYAQGQCLDKSGLYKYPELY